MRNLKKVLAVIVIVTMVLSTMMVSAFADDAADTVKTDGQICADLGILKGGADGVDEQYLATPTQRIQAAIIFLRLLGLEEEARAFDGTDNFTDASKVADASAKNILAYLKANPDLGWVGDGKNFNPDDDLTPQQLYKVLLTVLGYAQGTDFDYDETLFFAKFVGMSKIAKLVQVSNADLASALLEALASSFKGGGPSDTLVAKLVNDGLIDKDKAVAAGFEVVTNDIVSVEAPAAIDVVFGTAAPALPTSVKARLNDGSTVDADVTWDTTGYDGNKVGKYTLKGTVEGFADGVSIDVNVKDLVLDVVSVDVPNLRQMVITYNGAVSGDPVKDKANYTINGNNPVDVALSDDGKVVTLTTSVANGMGNYKTDNKLVIKKEVGNGLAADKTIENIVSRDTVVPTMLSVTATGPRSFKVAFSEPVSGTSIAGAFSLDDGKIGLDTAAANISANGTDTEITIKTLADFQEGAHTLKVSGSNLTDKAGYAVAGNTLSFNYAKDTAPLTVSIKSSNETSVTLLFNKDIAVNMKDANFQFSHTYKGYTATTVLGNVSGAVSGSGAEYTITFAGKPLPPGSSTLYISYVSSTGNKIKDGWGNELAETTLAITTSADTTAPTATAEFVDQNKVKVTFSEDVLMDAGANAANNPANYSLKSGDTVINVSVAARDGGTSNKVINLTTATINGGSLTLVVKNVKDTSVAGNKMADTTLTVAATDKVPPTVAGSTLADRFVEISATKFRINFSEAIDPAILLDKTNYFVTGSALKADDTLTAINDNKSVVIEFKTAPAVGDDIVVGKIKDIAGNWSTWLTYKVTNGILGTVTTIAADTIEYTGSNKVKITVKDQLSTTGTTADYVYSNDGSNWKNIDGIASFTVDTANNKTYIELNIAYDAGDDTDLTTPVYIATTGTSIGAASPNVKNGLGQTLKIDGTIKATDKYAPHYLSVTTNGAISGDATKLGSVKAKFSEHLYIASVSDADFTVEGFTVSGVEVDNNADGFCYVTISLASKDNSINEQPKVTLVGSVEDLARNVLTGPVEKSTAP